MRVAADIGGTFTDVVVFDESNASLQLAKTLSTPADLARGVRDGLAKAGIPLGEVESLIHGSTIVVNAVVERRGAKTALVTTKGFRDVYEIGRINRPESFNPRFRKHRPLVPREMIFEVTERVLADGSVRTPFNEQEAREVARILKEEGVEAVAVLFLHSYRAPEHELRMCEILRETDGNFFISASHELSREYREYERTSTVAANAYVGPKVSKYLGDLESGLKSDGFNGTLMIMQSNGGLCDVNLARRQCIQMMESGPAGGVVGTMAYCETLDLQAAIAFDMGGTTAKACVIRRGEPSLSPDYFIGGYNEGLAIRIPVLDIVEVGTGGGSIAWLDEGGALHVGPRSAGAEPGPVSYGRGGLEPTVTDANVILGRLAPERFLGGEMRLDKEAAEESLRERLAGLLNVTLERAASGMLQVATSAMANAVRHVTLERGLDPRDFTLVAYGGGGPLHAASVAKELSIGTVIIPQAPGHFSALGMLMADFRRDYVQTLFRRLDDLEMEELEQEFLALEAEGRAALERSGIAPERIAFERAADMRYVGQEHAVAVRMPASADESARNEIKRRFDEAHDLRYSHSAPEEAADIVSVRVSAIGRLAKPAFPTILAGVTSPPADAERGARSVIFEAHGAVDAKVFDRAKLRAGNVIQGPAVIEEVASTTIVEPGDTVTVNRYGHLVMKLGAA
ncbi:MAG TPA: hydantoinase/oxoprolinase family protein [Candidatus Binatia bacterium]|nr:hydantoinase/oxoprolinase family protein [Candidatus Binatia bacterium]